MKKFFQFALFLLALGFMTSCGSETATDAENTAGEAVEAVEEAATEAAETMKEGAEEMVDKSGPEYTSAYVCPMHCEGSGSKGPGVCPSCGMDYVMNENAGLKATEGAGSLQAEEGHEGHNH
jgi:hypothetical protein